MTAQEWLAECQRRIAINEGSRATMYHDTMGIPTIGIGFNLNRGDARAVMAQIGADYDAVMGGAALSEAQIAQLFAISFAPIVDEARASLAPSHFDAWLSDARRFVICDLVYNLGNAGWTDFRNTRATIDAACHAKATGSEDVAGHLFGEAADDLEQSAWYEQVGNRAKRDVAMIRSSGWVDPFGDGSS